MGRSGHIRLQKDIEMTEEIWVKIKGTNGLYEVSNLGNVRSCDRYVQCVANGGHGVRLVKGRLLKPQKGSTGYYHVHLSVNGVSKICNVHRLVAEAFLPNPNNLPCVNHKDEDPTNNLVYINPDGTVDELKSNLEWCSYQYNNTYGTIITRHKENALKRKVAQYTKDGKFVKVWDSIMDATAQLTKKRNTSNITKCCVGERNSAYGYKWRYWGTPDVFSDEDRIRLHQLLDYACDTNQDYVIMQFANMDLDWHLHKEIYRLQIKKEYDNTTENKQDN